MLELVDDARQIRGAWDKLQKAMTHGSRRVWRRVGTRAGDYKDKLIIREDLGIWAAPSKELSSRRWFPFGVLPLPETGNVSMVVQLNTPLMTTARGMGGCLGCDAHGKLWICHTGRIGGGRDGISRSAFLKWSDRPLVRLQRRNRTAIEVFPIAGVESPEMLEDIADYVHEVHAFKEGHTRPSAKAVKPPFREDESTYLIEGRVEYEATRFHGVVCNRLIELLSDAGYRVGNDKLRDVVIGKASRPDIEFEIKPAASWQHLYTGVGQLMLHSAGTPAKRQVLVVPASITDEKRKAIRSLGIDVVIYRTTKRKITFSGLATILDVPSETVSLRRLKSITTNGQK